VLRAWTGRGCEALYLASSPYARKSLVCAHELGLDRALKVVSVETSPIRSSPEVNRATPLGKVPALLRDNGPNLFDSAVICEYFNSFVVGATQFPPTGEERWRSLRMHALADGLCDAAIAIRRERSRPPALRWPDWEQAHLRKLHRPTTSSRVSRYCRMSLSRLGRSRRQPPSAGSSSAPSAMISIGEGHATHHGMTASAAALPCSR